MHRRTPKLQRIIPTAVLILVTTSPLPSEVKKAEVTKAKVKKVVLKGTTCEVTHELTLGDNEIQKIRINHNAPIDDAFLSKVVVEPDIGVIATLPNEPFRRKLSRFYPGVVKFGEGGDFDFKVDELWKKLLGKNLVLTVERNSQSVKLDGKVEHDEKTFNLRGEIDLTKKPREVIVGKLVGISAPDATTKAYQLTILNTNGNPKSDSPPAKKTIVQVLSSEIISMRYEGVESLDVNLLSQLLNTLSDHAINEITLTNTKDTERSVSITYTHTVSAPTWTVRHTGRLDKDLEDNPTKLTLSSSAEILNQTFHDWGNIPVTLKFGDTGSEKVYTLSAVKLNKGKTKRFLIDSLEGVSLKATAELRVTAPPEVAAQTTDQEETLFCNRFLSLENNTNARIPGGRLVILPPTISKPLAVVDLPELEEKPSNPKKRQKVGFAIKPIPKLSIAYTRLKKVRPVAALDLDEYQLHFAKGRIARLEFKVKDKEYSTASVEVRPGGKNDPQSVVLSFPKKDKQATLPPIIVVPTLEKESTLLKVLKDPAKPNVLVLREALKSGPGKDNLNTTSTQRIGKLITYAVGYPQAAHVRSRLTTILGLKRTANTLTSELSDLRQELTDLKDREMEYGFQARSRYHGPILRDLINRVQRKEMEIGDKQAEVAQARYQIDQYLRQSRKVPPPTPVTTNSDLGGWEENEEEAVVLVSFGGGYPGNQIQDSDLKSVVKTTGLKQLSLRSCVNISDKGLAHLKTASDLEWLVLYGTSITDASLQYLDGLSKLEYLDLRNTGVTQHAVRLLQGKLPHCRIEMTAPPSLSGLPERRWVFILSDLSKETTDPNEDNNLGIADVIQLMREASSYGYNGIVIQDYGFGFGDSGNPTSDFLGNLVRLRREADVLNMTVAPTVTHSSAILNSLKYVPLAEGVPVKEMAFKVEKDHNETGAENGKLIACALSAEKLKSGTFETDDWSNDWSPYSSSAKVQFELDAKDQHASTTSLKVQHKEVASWGIHQDLALKPWHQYRFSFFIRTDGFQVDTKKKHHGLFFKILAHPFPDDKGISRKLTHFELKLRKRDGLLNVKSTQDWKEYQVVFNTFADCQNVTIQFFAGHGSQGTIWMDDFSVKEIGGFDLIRREGCPIKVTSKDGQTEYREKKDFEYWTDPDVDDGPHEPRPIRIKGNRIKENAELNVSYYHSYRTDRTHIAPCLRHEQTFELYERQIQILGKLLRPQTWIMDHDEIRVAGHCELCRKNQGETVGEILAENAARCEAIIRRFDPKAEIRVWNDMFDPHHNAVNVRHKDSFYPLVASSFRRSWVGLSESVRINNWNGGPTRKKSLDFFEDPKHRHRQLFAGFYDHRDDWSSRLSSWIKDARPLSTIDGVMYSTYERDYKHLEEFMKQLKKEWQLP